MKKTAIILFLLLGVFTSGTAQELNNYKYVQVPVAFDAFKEENQYQVNALTAFLLEKQGFEVFYNEEVPREIPVCEILKAKLEEDSGLFTTKVVLTLDDCHGNNVFTSTEGSSREKEFEKAYHAAIRDAFKSLDEQDYSYAGKPVLLLPEKASEEAADALVSNTREEGIRPTATEVSELPSEAVYRNGSTEYRLEKTSSGYSLYKEEEEKEFAKLLKSGGGDNYIYTSNGLQGNAYFDAEANLVVEYVDANFGQLVSVKYLLQH